MTKREDDTEGTEDEEQGMTVAGTMDELGGRERGMRRAHRVDTMCGLMDIVCVCVSRAHSNSSKTRTRQSVVRATRSRMGRTRWQKEDLLLPRRRRCLARGLAALSSGAGAGQRFRTMRAEAKCAGM